MGFNSYCNIPAKTCNYVCFAKKILQAYFCKRSIIWIGPIKRCTISFHGKMDCSKSMWPAFIKWQDISAVFSHTFFSRGRDSSFFMFCFLRLAIVQPWAKIVLNIRIFVFLLKFGLSLYMKLIRRILYNVFAFLFVYIWFDSVFIIFIWF